MSSPTSSPTTATRVPWGFVTLAFLTVFLDGFDTATLSFSLPVLAAQWGMAPSGFSTALVLTNLGVVIGYVLSGPLGARIGQRRLLALGTAGFGLATLLTVGALHAESILLLDATRLITGIGLGGVLPVAVSLAAGLSPLHRRDLVSVLVTLGLATGATFGGFAGGPLLRAIGVSGVFLVAAIAPIIVAIAVAVIRLPQTPAHLAASPHSVQEAKIGNLWSRQLRVRTLLLWIFSFLIFLVAYTITSWAPTLLGEYGFDQYEAPLGLAMFSGGGVLGGLLLIAAAGRFGIARSLVGMAVVAVAALGVFVLAGDASRGIILASLLCAGAGLTACQIGQLTMAVSVYPERTRATGVGWSAALGRLGSIIGPAAGGLFLALAVSAQTIVAIAIAPLVIALLVAVVLAMRSERAHG